MKRRRIPVLVDSGIAIRAALRAFTDLVVLICWHSVFPREQHTFKRYLEVTVGLHHVSDPEDYRRFDSLLGNSFEHCVGHGWSTFISECNRGHHQPRPAKER